MPERFVIPQFIDEEAKIIGPVTGRQFVLLLVGVMFEFIVFRLADFALFLLIGIPFGLFIVVLAFLKIRGQKFHYFLLSFFQKLRRPNVRVWQHTADMIVLVKPQKPVAKKPEVVQKTPITTGRLTELSLVVNTGGVYHPDDE